MGKLIYSAIASADGYIEDAAGSGGAGLAGQAIKAGLVDELQLFLVPVIVGGGKRALPNGVRSDLELLDTQRFASGAVYLRYRLTPA